MIREARPMTMLPAPICTSAKFWLWAMKAPLRATRPLLSTRPRIFMLSVLMPWARTMRGLLPVARTALPSSVPKNQYRMEISARAHSPPTMMMATLPVRPALTRGLNTVFIRRMETLGAPMMRRLME